MKLRITSLAVPLCLIAADGRAQDPSAIFNEAVSSYQRGRYDSAAIGFLQLTQGGIDDPRVWYNLGNSQFKNGHIGAALIAYRRGMRLEPRDNDLVANYRYVRLFAADKIEPVGELFLEQWWRAAIDKLSLAEATGLTAILFWIAALITIRRFWPQSLPRLVPRPWMIFSIWLLWLTASAVSVTCYARDVVAKDGFVTAVQSDVRGGPGSDYTLQFVAHDGLAGTVERTESGWHLVQFPNGLKGWLAASAFEII